METLKTLEDLRLYLHNKCETEWKAWHIEGQDPEMLKIIEATKQTTEPYELSSDEFDYVTPIKLSTEGQSNRQTLINAEKAMKILLKKKK